MKKIKIKYVDFWPSLNPEDFIFTKLLRKHFEVEISDNPDYIFYSLIGNKDYLNYDCVRIFYTGENFRPDFNLADYAIGFDKMNFNDRYIRFPYYLINEKEMNLAEKKHLNINNDILNNKSRFCNYVYSNSNAEKQREEFFYKLSNYKKVDSGGKFLNNIGGPIKDKFEFQSKYKFSIAFENTTYPGYATEKILQSLGAKTIPIYWGNPEITEVFNGKSFINCHDYKCFDDVIEKIKEIDNNDDLFLSMLKEPTFINKNYYKSELDNLENFLVSIFQQEYEKSFRRPRFYWGANYEKDIKTNKRIKEIIHSSKILNLYFKIKLYGLKKVVSHLLGKDKIN